MKRKRAALITRGSVALGPDRLSENEFAAYALKNGAEGHLLVNGFSSTNEAILLTHTRFQWIDKVLSEVDRSDAKFDALIGLISDVVECNNDPANDGKPPAPFSAHIDTLVAVTWAVEAFSKVVYSSEKSKATFKQLGDVWKRILSKSNWSLGIEDITRSGVHCLLRKVRASLPQDLGEELNIEPSLQSSEVSNCAQM